MKEEDRGYEVYSVLLTRDGQDFLYYPTFCDTNKGLRLLDTDRPLDKDGNVLGPEEGRDNLRKGLDQFGAGKTCRTIWLTSALS